MGVSFMEQYVKLIFLFWINPESGLEPSLVAFRTSPAHICCVGVSNELPLNLRQEKLALLICNQNSSFRGNEKADPAARVGLFRRFTNISIPLWRF